ncbi:hypothetical protein [Streptomyces fradiae]|uniref:hypothetical protein n=1 Tax=Streptomyces fradiae TaxID=1906 RepID=UPI00294353C4|nr:hypothetical protein [Streptomyces fradiae]WOI59360.1 hypothetical protein RYQ63_05230 [Streptomyces fradiae]
MDENRFITQYDNLEDPDQRAEFLLCHGIHGQELASMRRRLAKRAQARPTVQAPPSGPSASRSPRPARHRCRSIRRPVTRRRDSGSPRATPAVSSSRKTRAARRTVVITTTTTTTITAATTVTRTVTTVTTTVDR